MAKRLKKLDAVLKDIRGENMLEWGEGTDGKPELVTMSARKWLTTILMRGRSTDAVHAIDLALKLHRNASSIIILDDTDITLMETQIKDDTQATDLVKAFLLGLLSNLEEAKS